MVLYSLCSREGSGTPLQYSCLENPGMVEPGGLPSMGSHRVGHDWSDLAAAAAAAECRQSWEELPLRGDGWPGCGSRRSAYERRQAWAGHGDRRPNQRTRQHPFQLQSRDAIRLCLILQSVLFQSTFFPIMLSISQDCKTSPRLNYLSVFSLVETQLLLSLTFRQCSSTQEIKKLSILNPQMDICFVPGASIHSRYLSMNTLPFKYFLCNSNEMLSVVSRMCGRLVVEYKSTFYFSWQRFNTYLLSTYIYQVLSL